MYKILKTKQYPTARMPTFPNYQVWFSHVY